MAMPAAEPKERGRTPVHPRWFQHKQPDKMADEIVSICDGLEKDDSARKTRYRINHQLYELRTLSTLNAAGYYTQDDPEDLVLPIVRSVCDTVQADIAGRQRPLPMFMTSGADWKTRRKAKKLGRFVEGVLHQSQGSYVNGWELAVDCFLDCEISDGVINVYVDESTDSVVLERVPAEEIHVDMREAAHGAPANFFREYLMDEDKVLQEFVECLTEDDLPDDESEDDLDDEERSDSKKKRLELHKAGLRDAIESAAITDNGLSVEAYGTTRIARSVKIREGLRLPLSKDEPGTHAYAIPGKLLHREDWERSESYVFMRWSRQRRGFWGISLVDEVRKLAAEANRTFSAMQERMVLCANKRTYVPNGAHIENEQLQANESENIVRYDGPQAPTESNVPALNPADFDWAALVKSLCFEMPGVSQMSATGRKEPGVTAGVAIRAVQDMAAKRFSVKARYAYEYAFVALARKIVDAVAEYVERTGRTVVARLPQKHSVQEFDWRNVKLERDFEIQIAPASSLPSDPAGRLSTVQDLFNARVIGPITFKRLIDWPDLEQEMSRDTAEWEYVESLIERYLDAEEGDDTKFDPPDGYLVHPEQALLQFSGAYFEAKRDGCPEYNLTLLRRYMQGINKLIERRIAAMQQAAAGPAAPTALPPAVGPLSAVPEGAPAPGPALVPPPQAAA